MPEAVFEGLAKQTSLMETLLSGCVLDEQVMKRLEGNSDKPNTFFSEHFFYSPFVYCFVITIYNVFST